MSFETALFQKLSSGVSLVSNRVYAGVAPQKVTTPYIVFSKISAGRQYTHSESGGLSRDRVQVSVFSTGYLTAKGVVAQVVTALEGFAQAGFKENEIDIYESETNLFHVPVDFFIWHAL